MRGGGLSPGIDRVGSSCLIQEPVDYPSASVVSVLGRARFFGQIQKMADVQVCMDLGDVLVYNGFSICHSVPLCSTDRGCAK